MSASQNQRQLVDEQLPAYTDALKNGASAPQSLEEKKRHSESTASNQESVSKRDITKKVLKAIVNGPSAGQNVARPHRYW
jgi:hypothetical protein